MHYDNEELSLYQLKFKQSVDKMLNLKREGNFMYLFVKADMEIYIPLETVAIFFLANLFPQQGISSEYVTADFICMGLLGLHGAKTENFKMKNSCPYRDSNSRSLILKSSALSMRLSSLIYKR